MPAQRLARLISDTFSTGNRGIEPERLCEACVSSTSMTGASVMLMSKRLPVGYMGSTGYGASARIDELQFTLGEGPSIDAYRQRRPVVEPDLAHPGSARWVAFSAAAVDAGAQAVFGFPLLVGSSRIGALSLCRGRPGDLSGEEHADLLVLAGLLAMTLLAGENWVELDGSEPTTAAPMDLWPTVHQAAGMVAVQLGVPIAEALIRLRARAFAENASVVAVAGAVVDRQLCFERDRGAIG